MPEPLAKGFDAVGLIGADPPDNVGVPVSALVCDGVDTPDVERPVASVALPVPRFAGIEVAD